MRSGRQAEWMGDLERIFAGNAVPPEDRALLDGFIRHRDEAAFEALVVRHGPMVRGVCRRVLREAEDVDDAFQATFLVLFLKARRIGDADRLSPWLFGVATRVARKARVRAARRQARLESGVVPVALIAPARDPDRFDLPPLIDAEIARLPSKLRAAVVLCLVEGTTPDEASRRLGCPVGTVKSRLARGRATLRARLTRRGVAPAVALATLDQITPAPLSVALIRATLAVSRAPTIAPTLLALTQGVAPAMITKSTAIAALLLGGFALAGGEWSALHVLRPVAKAQAQAPATPPRPRPKQSPVATTQYVDQPLKDRLAALMAESKAHTLALYAAAEKTTDPERNKIFGNAFLDEEICCRRLIDLALTDPADPAARDALIWVINMPNRTDSSAYGDEVARASALLVRHHGDDPVAVSVGLGMNNSVTAHRDSFLYGFLASAKGRESQGMARLALARYLEHKTAFALLARKHPERRTPTFFEMVGDDGKLHRMPINQSDEDYAYLMSLRFSDPAAIKAEAERLYQEVISEYGEVPYVTPKQRELAALIKEPVPRLNGQPLTDEERQQITALVARKQNLGMIAVGHLDEMRNIIPGKPAPAIDGVELDGKSLKLADYRGKVVVLVFWGSWCGPCMASIPEERDLAAHYKDKPFTLLGVDCRDTPEAGRKVVETNGITWPNFHDNDPDGHGEGPIVASYHVGHYPSMFVIDAQGIIRHRDAGMGQSLIELLDPLIAEAEQAGASR